MLTTVSEIRRANLVLLLKRFRSIADFNVAVGKARTNPGFTMIKNRAKNGGKTRVMGDNLAREVEAKLNLPVGWMDVDHSEGVSYVAGESADAVPIKTLTLAGADQMNEEIVNLDRETLRKFFPGRDQSEFSAAIVHDESMSPAVKMGDRVLIDETQTHYTKDGIYCLDIQGILILRRIALALNGLHIVSSDAQQDDRQPLEKLANVRIVGRVCAIWNCRIV